MTGLISVIEPPLTVHYHGIHSFNALSTRSTRTKVVSGLSKGRRKLCHSEDRKYGIVVGLLKPTENIFKNSTSVGVRWLRYGFCETFVDVHLAMMVPLEVTLLTI